MAKIHQFPSKAKPKPVSQKKQDDKSDVVLTFCECELCKGQKFKLYPDPESKYDIWKLCMDCGRKTPLVYFGG